MNAKAQRLLAPIILVLAIFAAMIGFLPNQGAQAAPPAAPTPVANLLETQDGQARFFRFQPATAIAADTNTTGREVWEFDSIDVQYVIDQTDAATNTITLNVQYSNDNSNWVAGLALVSSNSADGTDLTRVPVFGRYMRINQDVTNTNTVTVTLIAVGR